MLVLPYHRCDLPPGEVFNVGQRTFGRCVYCYKVVWLNRPWVRSLHRCRPS